MNLHFDQPAFLLLGLLAIPLVLIGWRALAMTDSLRRFTALLLRTIVVLALAIMLAGPRVMREHDHLTVIGLLDISGSVQRFADLPAIYDQPLASGSAGGLDQNAPMRRSNIEYLRNWFRKATNTKAPEDRFGLVVFDGKAIAISAPTKTHYTDDNLDVPIAPGTNIAEAVRLGLAMFPADSARRLVLVTDGNETAGDVREAIRAAQQTSKHRVVDATENSGAIELGHSTLRRFDISIPVDVLPIAYHVTKDVQVARIEAPPNAMPGQTVTVRIILEAASPTTGLLTLRRENEPVDLNGTQPGTSRHVTIPAGPSVQLAQVTLGQTPINRFEAVFEPDDPRDDALPDNNRAEAFTATPSKGSVLVLDRQANQRTNMLVQILNAAKLPAQSQLPSQLPDDLLSLQNYDLIVLDNIAAADLNTHQQELLSKYVNDLGGGLIMLGGENSFGAGGWNNTPIASILPVNVDPTKELRLPSAALVLVLDKSGSMNQSVAGARATQQQVANEGAALAIESLRSNSLIGVISFDMFCYTVVPLQPNDHPRAIADKVRGIQADGGTNMGPALERAFEMLKDAPVAKKRVVCMSDGRSIGVERLDYIAKQMADANIQLTTISVGDDSDDETMERLAKLGGGKYYDVRNPRDLPKALIDSVQVLNRPLLKEVPFVPKVLPTGSTLTAGMEQAPELLGDVITSPRDDPKVALEMIHPDGEPLLAHWQAGLGRVAAFTSDLDGPWSQRWNDWPAAQAFWTQLARMTARPPMNQDAELITTIQDDKLQITLEMSDGEGTSKDNQSPAAAGDVDGMKFGAFDFLSVAGTVYQPDGSATPVRLHQTAPGRYETSVDATQAGNYIVALNPRQGARQLSPAIGGTSRSSSLEFRRYSSNLGLLEEIVESTGGRRLDVNDPTAVNLFDRAGMPHSVSSLPIWRTILFWAIGLMLLDVACRRIAWDANLLRRLVTQAIERVTPSHVRGREAAVTLATLRRVGDQMEARQEADSAGVKKFQATGRIAPPPMRDETIEVDAQSPDATANPLAPDSAGSSAADAAALPDDSQVTAALDALLGRRPNPPPKQPSSKPPDSSDRDKNLAETTSNLLAAKRRARQRLQHGEQGDQRARE